MWWDLRNVTKTQAVTVEESMGLYMGIVKQGGFGDSDKPPSFWRESILHWSNFWYLA